MLTSIKEREKTIMYNNHDYLYDYAYTFEAPTLIKVYDTINNKYVCCLDITTGVFYGTRGGELKYKPNAFSITKIDEALSREDILSLSLTDQKLYPFLRLISHCEFDYTYSDTFKEYITNDSLPIVIIDPHLLVDFLVQSDNFAMDINYIHAYRLTAILGGGKDLLACLYANGSTIIDKAYNTPLFTYALSEISTCMEFNTYFEWYIKVLENLYYNGYLRLGSTNIHKTNVIFTGPNSIRSFCNTYYQLIRKSDCNFYDIADDVMQDCVMRLSLANVSYLNTYNKKWQILAILRIIPLLPMDQPNIKSDYIMI